MTRSHIAITTFLAAVGLAGGALGQTTVFSTNESDHRMAAGARIESKNAAEIEAADDFLLATDTRLTGATIVGLLPKGAALSDVRQVVVQIYRVFPLDSNPVRVPHVPTRTNSPADNALLFRDSADGSLTYKAIPDGGPVATALNSVVNGINPVPDQNTKGEGPVSGNETKIVIRFQTPIDLRPGRYFFVPQVRLSSGTFMWLSAPRPIVAPGTPMATDLQAWIRSGRLNPDWLRIGTDIVGGTPAPTFNLVMKLEGLTLCYADCDGSGVLTANDFVCYLNAFSTGQAKADCDTVGGLTANDFVCYMNSFAAGCP